MYFCNNILSINPNVHILKSMIVPGDVLREM